MVKRKSIITIAISFTLLMLLTPLAQTMSQTSNQPASQTLNQSTKSPAAISMDPYSTFQREYIDPELLSSAGPTRVLIIATNSLPLKELAKYMVSSRATPSIGGSYLTVGVMQAEKVKELAENQHVLAVLKDKMIEYDDTTSVRLPKISSKTNAPFSLKELFKPKFEPENGVLGSKPETTMRDVVKIIGADKTWGTYNITGKGITIAIVDTGVDYGAFSLAYWNSLARDVEGYPAAFDADALCMAFTNITVTAYETPNGTFIPTAGIDPYIYIFGSVYRFSELVGLTWFSDMNVTGILSAGEEAHFGLMFQYLFGLDLFPVLVVDANRDGAYDTVYVDMSFDWSWIPLLYYLQTGIAWPFWTAPWPPDFSFADEKPLTPKDFPLAARDFTGDGIYDLSAGVLGYFLDVWAVAPNIYDKGLVLKPIDPYGNYTCFVNDWVGHGTSCASCAAGRDKGHPLTGAGVAPSSKIMSVVALWIGDIIEGQLWAAGFDLVPGSEGWTNVPGYGFTYGTWNYTGRHKADIISNSWGVSEWAPSLLGLPWYDVLSMLEDALTIPGYLAPDYPGTVIVHASGNGGAGYGTFTSPGYASLPIGVGASTSMNWTSLTFGFAGGYYDEVIPWSARGPTLLGYVKPDVVNIGARGFVATTVWAGLGDGAQAIENFGGTSMATPLTAGAASLIVQAYNETYGTKPIPELTKVFLKSTAKDLGYDAFVQGAGRVDVFSAVELALGKSGITISSSATWSNVRSRIDLAWSISSAYLYQALPPSPPPEPINDTGWFAGFVQPGGTATAEFSVTNPSASAVEATITPVIHEPLGPVLKYEGYTGSMPADWERAGWPWGNLTTLNKAIIPSDADLMLVSLTVPYQYFDVNEDYKWDHRWGICIQDWNDMNADGRINVNEVYQINYGYNTGTSNEARISFPTSKFKFTPVIFIYQLDAEGIAPVPIPFTVRIQFYKRITWNWMTVPNSISAVANSSETFDATLSVPPNATQGVYEGQIILNITVPYTKTTAIPVSVNVPAVIPTDALTYDITPPSTTELYDPYSVNGYFDWRWRYEAGDWKTWLIDVKDPSVVAMFVSCNWTGEMTDIDMFAINPNGFIVGNATSPYLLTSEGAIFQWLTGTGTTSEYVASPTSLMGSPTPGIYTILLHNVLFNGTVYPEKVTGKIELVKLTPREPATLPIKPGNSASFTFTLSTGRTLSNISIGAYPYTPFLVNATPSFISEIPAMGSESFTVTVTIPEDIPTGTYPVLIEVIIPELMAPPMYMPVIALVNVVADNTPPIIGLVSPNEGQVIGGAIKIQAYARDELDTVKSVEYSIAGGPYTNMTLDAATGLWTTSVDTTKLLDGVAALLINATDRAGNSAIKEFTLTIDNTKPTAEITVPDYVRGTVPIAVNANDQNFDRAELYVSGELVETWTAPGAQTYGWNTTELTDGAYLVKLIVYDKAGNMATNETSVVIDNTMPIAEIRAPLVGSHVRGTYQVTVYGQDVNLDTLELYVNDSLVKTLRMGGVQTYMWDTATLTDGAYTVKLVIRDKAGNTIEDTVTVTVDNTAPTVSITAPAAGAELLGTVTIQFTASDANLDEVFLYIDNAVFNVTGTTSYSWATTTLGDGSHTIRLAATDRAGNSAEKSIGVVTVNVRRATEDTRNTYLATGLPIGLVIGALIAYVLLRRRKVTETK